jgi:hypothetical protein
LPTGRRAARQERALAAVRTRAGIVLSAAAIVTSFLGGQAIGASVDVPLHAIHRDLALHMENSYSSNERRHLRPLRWAFRVAVIALVAEVAIWLIELATAGQDENRHGRTQALVAYSESQAAADLPEPDEPGHAGHEPGRREVALSSDSSCSICGVVS